MAKMLLGLQKNLRASHAICRVSSTITFFAPSVKIACKCVLCSIIQLKTTEDGYQVGFVGIHYTANDRIW